MTATLAVPPALSRLSQAQAEELACKAHLGVWTARKRLLDMAPLHWEWCELAMNEDRVTVIAPREHSKTETFTVNATAWRSIYTPGLWTQVFTATDDVAKKLLVRVEAAIAETAPWLVNPGSGYSSSAFKLEMANGAMVTVAGAGKSTRSIHPDIIIGDDVLEEQKCRSEIQRKKTIDWWMGTVSNMAHPGTMRMIRSKIGDLSSPYISVQLPPTRVFLVGTPFHAADLLMAMKKNPIYRFRRYAAEYRPDELVPGTLAVEVA